MAKKKNSSKKNRSKKLSIPTGITKNNTNSDSSSISVCMIVKDEEKFLDKCLQSVKDIAAEIIVVDTGSQDNTVSIAKKYTDKIFFHPWKDSFSEARNHYLGYATGDWIFQIDADEELDQSDIPVLLKAVKNPDIDAVMVQIVSRYKKGKDESLHNVERIFRNNGKIHYEGRVHNRLVDYEKPQIYPIRLLHYGYDLDDLELSERKHQRRIRLLKQDIADDPNNPLPYHYLGCCYLPKGLYHETLEVSLHAIALAEQRNDKNPIFLWSRYNAAMAYYRLKDLAKAETMSHSALKIYDRHIDSYFVLTLVSHEQKKWREVIHFGEKYIRLGELFKTDPKKFGIVVSNTLSMDWNILFLMGIAYSESEDNDKAMEAFKLALNNSKEPVLVLRAIGIYYYNKGIHSMAEKYLKRAWKLNSDDPTLNEMLTHLKPVKTHPPTISCCMIVKNEEEFLDQCLASVKDYVDELIIVDTGSTDSTVEIAKRYTDKVYFHPWENSFSKARNQALSYATGDWVFQIDGDEELMSGNGEKLRKAVQEAKDEDVIFVNIYCSYANGTKVSLHNFERLFRNNGIIHYEGSVHNRIEGYKKPSYSQIELWHYGYDVEKDKAQEKFDRTTGLLKREIEENPDNPLNHHYLSASYISRGMNNEALMEAEQAIQLADSQQNLHPIYGWSHFIASMASYKLKMLDKAEEYSLKASDTYPDHLDSYYMLTLIAAERCEWEAVLKFGKHFMNILNRFQLEPEQKGLIINNTMNEGPNVYTLMGHAYHAKQFFDEMNDFYRQAYDAAVDEQWRVWWNIGTYHMDKSSDMERAGYFLNCAVEEAPHEHDAWYMLAKYNNMCGLKDKELEALEKIIEIGAKEDFVVNRLFALYLEKNQYENALNLATSTNKLMTPQYSDLIKLGNCFIEKGHLGSAIKCYMKAAEVQPDSPEAWNVLGELTLVIGRFGDSQVFLERALQIDNHDTATILSLCELELRKGDIESHIKYCDMLLDELCLPRDRTIDSFEDLKSIFLEIGSTLGNNQNHSLKIKNIITQLNLDSDSLAQERPLSLS